MKTYSINGTYGKEDPTPCTIFVAEVETGGRWYAVEDSKNVGFTYEQLDEGVNTELVIEVDYFHAGALITSEGELIHQIEL